MSFLSILDPSRRDAIVNEYLATVKRLQKRDLAEKEHDVLSLRNAEKALEPMIRSNEKSTERLASELGPIKEEIKSLNSRFDNNTTQSSSQDAGVIEEKEEKEVKKEPNIVQRYFASIPKKQIDQYFGVVMDGDRYKMGNKYVQIVDLKDLLVDDKKYAGTIGLWSLIMKKSPSHYSQADLESYHELVNQTNVLTHPNSLTSTSRLKRTKKWKEILSKFDTVGESVQGSGIVQFLPRDIKGLEQRLNILLGEYRAGNRSCIIRNEIVSILDELLRRKRLSKREYQEINGFLGEC